LKSVAAIQVDTVIAHLNVIINQVNRLD